jgi:hypothetical protein
MHMRLATPGPRQRRASPTSLGPQWMIRALRGAGVDSQAPARMLRVARSCLRVDLPFRVPGTGASRELPPIIRDSEAPWQNGSQRAWECAAQIRGLAPPAAEVPGSQPPPRSGLIGDAH